MASCLKSAVNRKKIWHSLITELSLYILTASVAFLSYSPSTRCMCADSVYEQQLSMLDSYVTCSRNLTLLHTELKCNTQ
jgi:hypothetical protein